MAKKLNQQNETNDRGLSREDRKNEQICRMIERAEKQRLKREEKKKLATLNKTTSTKIGAPSIRKKKIGLLNTKRTQVAIRILFSDKFLTQNSQNRYYQERKQTIEEKQRLEQEEMFARYSMRMQQQQAIQQQQQQSSILNVLPAIHDNLSTQIANPYHQAQNFGMQQQAAVYNTMIQTSQNSMGGELAGTSQSNLMACQTPGQAVQQFYLNAGETGGNYEAGMEDHSGSSCFSSNSKRQQLQQPIQSSSLHNLSIKGFQLQPISHAKKEEISAVTSQQIDNAAQQNDANIEETKNNADEAQIDDVTISKNPSDQFSGQRTNINDDKEKTQLQDRQKNLTRTESELMKSSSGITATTPSTQQNSRLGRPNSTSTRAASMNTATPTLFQQQEKSEEQKILELTRQKMRSRLNNAGQNIQ